VRLEFLNSTKGVIFTMTNENRKILRVSIHAPDSQSLIELLKEKHLDVGGGPKCQSDGTVTIDAYVPEEILGSLQAKKVRDIGIKIEVVEDASETGRERQKEVGKGDRFEAGKKLPSGLARKV